MGVSLPEFRPETGQRFNIGCGRFADYGVITLHFNDQAISRVNTKLAPNFGWQDKLRF